MLGWARHQERNMTSLASMLVCVVSDCNWVIVSSTVVTTTTMAEGGPRLASCSTTFCSKVCRAG